MRRGKSEGALQPVGEIERLRQSASGKVNERELERLRLPELAHTV